MTDCFWSFYNQRSQARYDGFKTIQARGFVTAIAQDQMSDWIVWKEGNPDWRALSEFPELTSTFNEDTFAAEASEFNLTDEDDFQTSPGITENPAEFESTFTTTKSLASVSQAGRSAGEIDPDKKVEETATNIVGGIVPEDEFINISNLDLAVGQTPDVPRPDMRKSARYKRVIDAEVEYGHHKKLKTKTIDISTGGVLLETHLPADAKKNVRITLTRGALRIQAVGQNLLDKNGFPTRRYKFLDVDLPDLLRSWLLA